MLRSFIIFKCNIQYSTSKNTKFNDFTTGLTIPGGNNAITVFSTANNYSNSPYILLRDRLSSLTHVRLPALFSLRFCKHIGLINFLIKKVQNDKCISTFMAAAISISIINKLNSMYVSHYVFNNDTTFITLI